MASRIQGPGGIHFREAIVLALVFSSTLAAAGVEPAAAVRRSPRRPLHLTVASHAELAPVSAAELLGIPASRNVPAGHPLVSALDVPPVVRELPVVWEARLPASMSLERLEVTYAFVSPGGRGVMLGPQVGDDTGIPLSVEPSSPRVVGYEGETAVVQGGAVLRLHLDSLRHSGRYHTTLAVTLNAR